MQEGQLLMNQHDRNRLAVLKDLENKHCKQREAAARLEISVRQLQRLVAAFAERGDKAVMHGLCGMESNRKIDGKVEKRAIEILSQERYVGFGPTLASESLASGHKIQASRETVRRWMVKAGLWKAGQRRAEPVHVWRPRRSRLGELVQWDTSEHDWLEGRGAKLYLIAMIDDATSRAMARFATADTTAANMDLLEMWVRRWGRPQSYYTDKASLFRTTEKRKRDEPGVEKDAVEMPPTQIGRALRELDIVWTAAHSPQAKGRVERFFETAQDRLVKGMRLARVRKLEQAERYLQEKYLPWWENNCTVTPANGEDAHRPLEKDQDLAAVLSHVEQRQVNNGYTIQFEGKFYAIERDDIVTGLRGAQLRVEKRRDGALALRFGAQYLRYRECERPQPAVKSKPAARSRKGPNEGGKSAWMKDFLQQPGPSLGQAIAISNATS
jgi:transposase